MKGDGSVKGVVQGAEGKIGVKWRIASLNLREESEMGNCKGKTKQSVKVVQVGQGTLE